MEKKKIGVGSISLLLVVIAVLWSFNINGFCFGDYVLSLLNIPAWSDGTEGIHYTAFSALILLIPALLISLKFKDSLFSKIGKWLSIILIIMILLWMIFVISNFKNF